VRVLYRHGSRSVATTRAQPISLILDIGQGAGLAGATGIRPFLPPLLVGALARADAGIDFDGTAYAFLESPWFLAAVLAAAVASYAAGRRAPDATAVVVGTGVLATVIGALLFAGALDDGGRDGLPGLPGGAACALLGYLAVSGLLAGARRRLGEGDGSLIPVYADAAALALALVAVFAPPLGVLSIPLFGYLLVARRRRPEKHAGLRILR